VNRGPSEARRRAHEAAGEWPVPNASTLAAERARVDGDRLYLVDGTERFTFARFAGIADALAAGLRGLGLGAGDVVSWQLPTWWEGAALTVALDRIGAISNPLLPILRDAEVGFILRQARSKALVVPGIFRGYDHRELAARVRSEAPELEHVLVVRAEASEGMRAFEPLYERAPTAPLRPSPLGPHDGATIFYTSGTTAEPKGVLHTPSTLGAFARVSVIVNGTRPDDVGLLQFPVTHIGGIGTFVLQPLLTGSCGVYVDVWTPEIALDLIERERVTSAGGPPIFLQAILASPAFRPERVRTVRSAGLGAADVSPDLIRDARRRIARDSFRAYGMTECPFVTTAYPGDAEEKCVLTDGRASPGCRIRVVDDAGNRVPAGSEGEVLVFGPQLFVGYLDAVLDRDAFAPDGSFRSGDLGILDEDGYLRITGRKKDIIIRKGENISARAVEEDVSAHPDVAEVAVIGLPDPASGERVCAVIVPKSPGTWTLGPAEIAGFLVARGVMRQKCPEQIEIVAALPRNALGKVKKAELRKRFAKGTQ
jgi:cyclohexanecarboxylate-CoA ligase